MTTEALKHPPQDEGELSIKLPIEKLRTDGGTQPRAEMDLALVAEYAEDLKAGATFPAIEVVYDGSDYWVVDGFHRKAAAKMAGLSEFGVSVTQGDLNHAVWLSLAANSRHGKRRSRQDTQRAIRTALQGWGLTKSDREIARHVGCDDKTVGNWRSRLVATAEIPQSNERTGADGRTIDTTNIGRSPTPDPVDTAQSKLQDMPERVREKLARGDYSDGNEANRRAQFDAAYGDHLPEPTRTAQGFWEERRSHIEPHVSNNSGDNEWYTPPEYIEAARLVLGGFDLDPASSSVANEAVKAAQFYTEADDGLTKLWKGRVWMNPPYAKGLIDGFASKFAEHAEKGEITGIVLVNNATDTKWFGRLAEVAQAICFPTGRIRFLKADGERGAPLQGQAILYFGARRHAFIKEFQGFGHAWGRP